MAAPLRQLLNEPTASVDEMLDGLTMCHPGLRRLDGYTVVVRADIDKSKVALISGGGSGHEPSHAGWVGTGMLTAAVAGAVFASPSTASVLAAIMHVTGPAGCLVIVKNYTGDRLNFGLACEQAKAAGLQVELVVVGDDCALPDRGLGIAGRRGIAGTCLVHKVAGAAAEAGGSLAAVAAEARATADAVGSMGVALRSCVLPGQPREERIAEGMMEVGLGIHGEPGAIVSPLQRVDAVVDTLLAYITSQEKGRGYLKLAKGERVALLVNNLGTSTAMELSIAARRAVATLEGPAYGAVVERVFVGPFMTALDMTGLSLSVLKLADGAAARLDASCAAPAWPGGGALNRSPTVPAPALPAGTGSTPLSSIVPPAGALTLAAAESAALGAALTAAAESLIAAEAQLTAWDEVCGDGDCGSTLAAGAKAILADLAAGYPLAHPASVARAVASSLARSMGGSSGALYAIFLSAAATSLAAPPPSAASAAAAFGVGAAAVSTYGGASRGHRTMLDAMLPAADAMAAAAAGGASVRDALAAAAAAAEAGAEATKTMTAGAGRASYVPTETMTGVPDPGAKAVAMWLVAAARSLG